MKIASLLARGFFSHARGWRRPRVWNWALGNANALLVAAKKGRPGRDRRGKEEVLRGVRRAGSSWKRESRGARVYVASWCLMGLFVTWSAKYRYVWRGSSPHCSGGGGSQSKWGQSDAAPPLEKTQAAISNNTQWGRLITQWPVLCSNTLPASLHPKLGQKNYRRPTILKLIQERQRAWEKCL